MINTNSASSISSHTISLSESQKLGSLAAINIAKTILAWKSHNEQISNDININAYDTIFSLKKSVYERLIQPIKHGQQMVNPIGTLNALMELISSKEDIAARIIEQNLTLFYVDYVKFDKYIAQLQTFELGEKIILSLHNAGVITSILRLTGSNKLEILKMLLGNPSIKNIGDIQATTLYKEWFISIDELKSFNVDISENLPRSTVTKTVINDSVDKVLWKFLSIPKWFPKAIETWESPRLQKIRHK